MGFFTTSPAAPSAAPTFGAPAPTFGAPAPTFGTPAPTQQALPRHAATYQPKPVVIVAVIVAVVVALVLAAVQVRGHHRHLRLSATAGSYQLLDGQRWADLQKGMVDRMHQAGYHDALAGYYGTGDRPAAMVLANTTGGHSDSALQDLLRQFGPSIRSPLTPADAGRLGGEMRCTTMVIVGTTPVPVCIWVDHDTVGVVVAITGTTAAAPDLAVQIRQAVEH